MFALLTIIKQSDIPKQKAGNIFTLAFLIFFYFNIQCDSSVLILNDSDSLICRDIKIKDTRKSNVLYTGAGNGT